MLAVMNGVMLVLAMATFFGIVWWAWSAHRVESNRQASELPFALPEEYQNDRKAGDTYE